MQLINNTIVFVKKQLEDAEGGHDWFHIERVYKNALLIATRILGYGKKYNVIFKGETIDIDLTELENKPFVPSWKR